MSRRRDFLGFTAGAVAARTVLPLAARAESKGASCAFTANPDAELIAACARHPALLAAYNVELGTGDDAWNDTGPAAKLYHASRGLIAAAEPQTWEGVVAKANAARSESKREDGSDAYMDFTSDASAWAWDVMNDMLRLVGSAA